MEIYGKIDYLSLHLLLARPMYAILSKSIIRLTQKGYTRQNLCNAVKVSTLQLIKHSYQQTE